MKIEKETLQRYRSQLKPTKPQRIEDYVPIGLDLNQQRQVVEFALELIDAADGGPDIAKLRQELAEKENNLKAILTDVQEVLDQFGQFGKQWGQVMKAQYVVKTGLRYLRERKTKDFQSWKDYRVTVDEEFSAS